MAETDPEVLADGVTEDATDEAVKESDSELDAVVDESKPRVPTLAELKERARKAVSKEERLKHAMPFPLPTLGFEVYVGPLNKPEMYNRVFDPVDGIMAADDPEKAMDRKFVKDVVLNCVVDPELDEEALDLIIEASPAEFRALSKFCIDLTMIGTAEKLIDRLGEIDTEARDLFFDGLRGRSSMLTPA